MLTGSARDTVSDQGPDLTYDAAMSCMLDENLAQ